MPVKGSTVLPSPDTRTPDVPVGEPALAVAEEILSQLNVPHRVKFTPSQLSQDIGGSERSWQRECEIGNIGAVHVPGGWIVPWKRLVTYVAQRQNIVDQN